MAHTIDARGLACPQPVILTKEALSRNQEVVVIVNDETACENVKRLAISMGFSVDEQPQGAETHLKLTKDETCRLAEEIITKQGPIVTVISSETMGRGDDVLGAVLMKSFLHTLTQTSPPVDVVIFFNTGVKLAVQGSEVIDDLSALGDAGAQILVCGTCLNYFELKDKITTGVVSNMYDITQILLNAGRIIQI